LIDTGLHCPTGPYTAHLCLRRTELLYRNCAERRFAHCRIGKLHIAGVDEELPARPARRHQYPPQLAPC
jgi:hypothetical protein